MTLVLNEEQQILKAAAHDFLQSKAPVSHLRELRDGGADAGYSPQLWKEIAEMGWAAILVPEEYGGLGYGYMGLGIVLEQCGRTLTPSPLLASALTGVTALLRAGSKEQCASILPAVATGDHLFALAVDDTAYHCPQKCLTTVRKTDDGFVLSGTKTAVIDGSSADTLIVSARTADSGDISLFLVAGNAPGVDVHGVKALDTHRMATVRFDDVALDQDALLGEFGAGLSPLDAILDAARIGQSAELLGIAQEAFERTMEYLKQRKQFGVPIGSFQGLQHRAAIMFGEIEMCKSAVLHALKALDDEQENIAEIASLTKAKLCETTHTVTTEGIQMHGGIGMTDEYEIGFFLKRCKILETLYGDRYFHLDRFATLRAY